MRNIWQGNEANFIIALQWRQIAEYIYPSYGSTVGPTNKDYMIDFRNHWYMYDYIRGPIVDMG